MTGHQHSSVRLFLSVCTDGWFFCEATMTHELHSTEVAMGSLHALSCSHAGWSIELQNRVSYHCGFYKDRNAREEKNVSIQESFKTRKVAIVIPHHHHQLFYQFWPLAWNLLPVVPIALAANRLCAYTTPSSGCPWAWYSWESAFLIQVYMFLITPSVCASSMHVCTQPLIYPRAGNLL